MRNFTPESLQIFSAVGGFGTGAGVGRGVGLRVGTGVGPITGANVGTGVGPSVGADVGVEVNTVGVGEGDKEKNDEDVSASSSSSRFSTPPNDNEESSKRGCGKDEAVTSNKNDPKLKNGDNDYIVDSTTACNAVVDENETIPAKKKQTLNSSGSDKVATVPSSSSR